MNAAPETSPLPAASAPLMTELIFGYSGEALQPPPPPGEAGESPLLRCASCGVCVHACEYIHLACQLTAHVLASSFTVECVCVRACTGVFDPLGYQRTQEGAPQSLSLFWGVEVTLKQS